MRALIVDDDPTVCLLLSRILARDFNCEADDARNGQEALAALSRERYDFVLLDLLMPIMSGYETLQTIRRSTDLQHLPVMVMSALREEARVREAIDLGIDSYMAKPLRPADVSTRVARLVSRLGGAGAGAAASRSCRSLRPGGRVLVVDEDREFRHFVKGVLSPKYSVATAAGGAQGLRMALDHPPALILLGSKLGALRPALFLDQLRGMPRLGAVPVVAIVPTPADAPPPGADASIERTLDVEHFGGEFLALVAGDVETSAVVTPGGELVSGPSAAQASRPS
jgi:CheY-like chemotaxis protein